MSVEIINQRLEKEIKKIFRLLKMCVGTFGKSEVAYA